MANKLFLVGHGMQYTKGGQLTAPPGVTIHFAVPASYRSTRGVSSRHLSGALTTYSETVGPGGQYFEHYLCPDAAFNHEYKLKMFLSGAYQGNSQTWFVTIRGSRDVALSKIIDRLMRAGLSKPLEFVWTCCRSPIDELSKGQLEYEHGGLVEDPTPGEIVNRLPMPGHEKFETSAEGCLTVLCASEVAKKVIKYSDKFAIGKQVYSVEQLFGNPTMGTSVVAKGKDRGDEALSF